MTVYYNEHDRHAAAWLRELMAEGLIPDGDVDDRDIEEVKTSDLAGYAQCHFFAGIGGWPLALRLARWPDDRPVWTGSCPCQPFSDAGKRRGTDDPRHLWPVWRGLIEECAPPVVFGEQVASKAGRKWFAGVRADLEAMDYAAGCADLCAASTGKKARSLGESVAREVEEALGEAEADLFREWWIESGNYAIYDCAPGAPHIRQRLFWVAESSDAKRWAECGGCGCDGQEAGRDEAHGEPRACGEVCAGSGVAVAERNIGEARRATDEFGQCAEAAQTGVHAEFRRCCAADGLADMSMPRQQGRRPNPGGAEPQEQPQRGSAHCRMGLAERSRLEGHAQRDCAEGTRCERGSRRPDVMRSDAWTDAIAIECQDRRARRIPAEPGLFPLAHGVPGRVALLRGAGNAIVPQVAAEFVGAWMEVEE